MKLVYLAVYIFVLAAGAVDDDNDNNDSDADGYRSNMYDFDEDDEGEKPGEQEKEVSFNLEYLIAENIVNKFIISDYKTHECFRDCIDTAPKTCEYDFIVEEYITMSRACYNCTDTPSDCFRPHCVTGDGQVRPVRIVNRMMPGPGIHVCKDDTIVVNVYNELQQMEGVTIHWHGIMQKGTPFMDGVSMITQCPISSYTTFQYKFTVTQTGTYFWHGHTGLLRADGLAGSLVVRETSPTSAMTYYDEDLPEHTVLIQEWVPEMSSAKYVKLNHGQGDDEPDAIWLNGNAYMGELNTGSEEKSYVPYAVFKVTEGQRYRFRLISNGFVNCPFQVFVENHTLLIVATDGFDVDPVEVDSVTIFAGERYDVVINANKAVDNYWIDIIGREDCEPKGTTQKAVLSYLGAGTSMPKMTSSFDETQGLHANTVSFESNTVSVADMTSQQTPDRVSNPDDVKTFYMKVGFNLIPDPRYYDHEYYPLPYREPAQYDDHYQHQLAMQVDDITYRRPSSPALTQYDDIDEDYFCNRTSTTNCDTVLCECVHRIKLNVDDVVDLVLFAHKGHGIHPMHLHGHSFYVLGMEELNTEVNRSMIEELDQQGILKRNLTDPIRKDTVMVPDGGYAIIRFKADNPGWWLFHCHNNFHSLLGMTMVFQVGEQHQMPKIPKHFPKCGSWKHVGYSDDETNTCSSGQSNTRFNIFGLMLCLFSFVYAWFE